MGGLFEVDQSTISRYSTFLTPLIDQATAELRPSAEEAAEATRGAIALVNGTLWPCWSWAGERELWAGKYKTTGHGSLIITTLADRVTFVSEPVAGKEHDMAKLKGSECEMILGLAGDAIGDKGFIGIDYIITRPLKTFLSSFWAAIGFGTGWATATSATSTAARCISRHINGGTPSAPGFNREVPQEVVRVLLDHSSGEMTAHYARLHDTTVRRHWEKAREVNTKGEEVPIDSGGPLAEANWAKQRLGHATQALFNGFCGLPAVKTCPHANACLTCPMSVTTPEFLPQHRQHRQHRQQVPQIITDARHRHELTRAKAIQALRTLDARGAPIIFEAVAQAAAVSRSWPYAQPDIRTEIERLRAAHRRAPATPVPARQRSSDASLLHRLEATTQRIRQLAKENRKLREQLAQALGEQRATVNRDTASTPAARNHPNPVTIDPC